MKLFKSALLLVIGWCLAVFVYVLVMYTDAPLKACANGPYCGKTGIYHTETEYEAFQRWQFILFASWPFGLLAAVIRRQLTKPASETH